MKAVAFSTLALCLSLTAVPAESPHSASPKRLAGIVSLANRPCVVLEVAGPGHASARCTILSEGQADDGVEVTKIAPDKGSVEVLWQATNNATLRLNNATNLPVPGIVLEDADINPVLALFAQLTHRTMLRWPSLPATPFNLRASVKDQAGAARLLTQALVAKDLSIILDGEKFLMIVPNSKATVVKPHAPSAKLSTSSGTKAQPTAPGSGAREQEVLAPGMLDFRQADVCQAADVYAAMVGRKLDLSERPYVGGTISVRTETSITLEEAIYALDTLLRWSGIKMVPVGDDQIKAVRDPEY
jgi:hypothetical protein